MKGDKAAADHEGRQMKGDTGDKAAASRPFRDFGDRATQSLRSKTPIVSSYLGNEGGQMKAGAAKSRPECRETNEGRQMKAGKSRPE